MKNHFKLQSLVFYGVAISSVLLLFKVVTAYGETNLKAPALIEARYRLSLDQNLPNCLQLSDLVLDLQQSGIYLNASLLPADSNAHKTRAGEKRPSLTGKLGNQQLQLSGSVPISEICNRPVGSTVNAVTIQSQIEKAGLAGKLTLAAIGESPHQVKFTAQRETPAQPAQNSSSH
jgi:hypothetical protein